MGIGDMLQAQQDAEDAVRYREIQSLLREMFQAEDAYGCGFYGQESWLKPYERLRELAGFPNTSKGDA
jgi:hypothetical protein